MGRRVLWPCRDVLCHAVMCCAVPAHAARLLGCYGAPVRVLRSLGNSLPENGEVEEVGGSSYTAQVNPLLETQVFGGCSEELSRQPLGRVILLVGAQPRRGGSLLLPARPVFDILDQSPWQK